MLTDDLNSIVNRLDRDIPRDNAKITIQRYGGDLSEAFVVGTPNGYLRLGVEFLKAGLAPHASPGNSAIDVDVEYLIDDDSDVQFDYFERKDQLAIKTYQRSFVDKLIPWVLLAIVGSVLVLAIVGVRTVLKAIF
ncbi:MAG TPA: hypothetical protein VLA93_20030 [Pyrinomonadaceae bacterium]|nr:hypothetical protein [Pyrinomonadaceae bacterium]